VGEGFVVRLRRELSRTLSRTKKRGGKFVLKDNIFRGKVNQISLEEFAELSLKAMGKISELLGL
jgi:hypothetical protein